MNHLVFNFLNFQTLSKTGVKEPSGMKRDTSKIFTVPEEGELDSTNYSAPQYVSSVSLAINHESPIRRKQEIKSERPKGGVTAHPLTPSVCATPLKDVDRVLHGNAMLICSSESGGENEELRNSSKRDDDDIPDVVKEALRYVFIFKLIFRNFVKHARLFEDMAFMANVKIRLMTINFLAIK